MASFNIAAANYIEFIERTAGDIDASARTYDGTEDDNTAQFKNLDTVKPPKPPRSTNEGHDPGDNDGSK